MVKSSRVVSLVSVSLLASVALVSPQAGCLDAPDHLDLVQGVLSESSFNLPYFNMLRSTLLEAETEQPYFRMVSIPAFFPESVVTVDTPAGGSSRVRVVDAERMVWRTRKPRKVRVVSLEASIPARTAESLRSAAEKLLLATAPCQALDGYSGFDGVTYEFSGFFINRGVLAGETWSPKEGTRSAAFVAVAQQLAQYVRSEPSRRGDLLIELDSRLAELVRQVSEASSSK